MSEDAEKEASEVLHSLLSIERVQVQANNDENSEKKIENDEYNNSKEDNEDSQNEIIDIETTEDEIKKPQKIRYKKQKFPSSSFTSVSATNENCDSSEEEDDDDTPESVAAHLKNGCGCKVYCFNDLNSDEVYKHRLNIAELTKAEHDMYLMGVTMASMANSKTTSRNKERQRQRATYVYQGKRVCLDAFLFLENVTLYQMKRIRNHVLIHGVAPRKHGNLGKKPHNTFSLDMYKNVENFVKKYIDSYTRLNTTGNLNKSHVICGTTRKTIYNSYKDHGRKSDEKLMGYSTFRHFMKKQFPQIRFQKFSNSLITSKHNENLNNNNSSQTMKKRMKSNEKNIHYENHDANISMEYNISNFSVEIANIPENIIKHEPETNEITTYILTPISVDK